jgi:hypothetical protein
LPEPKRRFEMAIARVVEFDGVSGERMQELRSRMESGEPPEGMPDSELLVLHDAGAGKSIVVLILDSEDDYQKADQVLQSMPSEDTPGQRTSVRKMDVAMRMGN